MLVFRKSKKIQGQEFFLQGDASVMSSDLENTLFWLTDVYGIQPA